MASFNRIVIMGKMGREPEGKTLDSGKQVANFSLAVDEGFGDKRRAIWFNCSAWGHSAKFLMDYAHKGDTVLAEGRMVSREYTNKDGQKVTTWEVQVDNATIASSPTGRAERSSEPAAAPAASHEDLPF